MEKVNEFKPQWKDAPDWARFLAHDVIFGWYWYENEPVLNDDDIYESSSGRYKYAIPNGVYYPRHMEPRP